MVCVPVAMFFLTRGIGNQTQVAFLHLAVTLVSLWMETDKTNIDMDIYGSRLVVEGLCKNNAERTFVD
jgi:hypothetical protein